MTAALVGLICVASSGVILIKLHFLPTGLEPIRYAVSDYGSTSTSWATAGWSCCRASGRSSSRSRWGNRPM